MIQKASGRKADAPSSLPISEDITDNAQDLLFDRVPEAAPGVLESLEEEMIVKEPEDLMASQALENPSSSKPKTVIEKASPPPNLPTA